MYFLWIDGLSSAKQRHNIVTFYTLRSLSLRSLGYGPVMLKSTVTAINFSDNIPNGIPPLWILFMSFHTSQPLHQGMRIDGAVLFQ